MEQNRKPVALTVEQMKMLKDLGYDTSKASMAYYTYGSGKTVLREASDDAQVAKKCVPAFTLEDVLAILPAVQQPFGFLGNIYPHVVRYTDTDFTCEYHTSANVEAMAYFKTTGSSALEAAFNMLLECHKRGYFGKVTVLENGTKIYG